MNKATIVYDKIKDLHYFTKNDEVMVKVFFMGGSNHVISGSRALAIGSIVGIDSHGSVWVKEKV